MANYGLDRDKGQYRGVGRHARIVAPGDQRRDRRRYNDVGVVKGTLAGAGAGAAAGGIYAHLRDKKADPAVVQARERAEKQVKVKRKNVERHIKKGGGGNQFLRWRNKQARLLRKSMDKLDKAKEVRKSARAAAPLRSHPMLKGIGKGAAVGAGAGLLGALLMEEKKYALDEIFEFMTSPWNPAGDSPEFDKEYWERAEKDKEFGRNKEPGKVRPPPKGAPYGTTKYEGHSGRFTKKKKPVKEPQAKPDTHKPANAERPKPPQPSGAKQLDAPKKSFVGRHWKKGAAVGAGAAVLGGAFYAMKKRKERKQQEQMRRAA